MFFDIFDFNIIAYSFVKFGFNILVHDVHPFSSSSFNTTHIIKHLSFGEKLKLSTSNGGNPLDSTESTSEEGKYHIILY